MILTKRRGSVCMSLWIAFCIFAAGCDSNVYRIDHLHSDSNQKLAEQASAEFEAFSSQQIGLNPTLLKNLQARQKLSVTVAEVRDRVGDTGHEIDLKDVTWRQQRQDLFLHVGLVKPGEAATGLKDSEIQELNGILEERLSLRLQRVAAIGETLNLISASYLALVEQSKKDVEQATKDLAAAKPEKKDNEGSDDGKGSKAGSADSQQTAANDQQRAQLVDIVDKLYQAIAAAAGDHAAALTKEGALGEFERKLIEAARDSRDPASAYAVAALSGTGLSQDDLDLLDQYIKHLKCRLDALEGKPSDDCPLDGTTEAQSRLILESASQQTAQRQSAAPNRTPAGATQTRDTAVQRVKQRFDERIAAIRAATQATGVVPPRTNELLQKLPVFQKWFTPPNPTELQPQPGERSATTRPSPGGAEAKLRLAISRARLALAVARRTALLEPRIDQSQSLQERIQTLKAPLAVTPTRELDRLNQEIDDTVGDLDAADRPLGETLPGERPAPARIFEGLPPKISQTVAVEVTVPKALRFFESYATGGIL